MPQPFCKCGRNGGEEIEVLVKPTNEFWTVTRLHLWEWWNISDIIPKIKF